ncbi:MAG: M20/M25/M40 family metallo-hydrolase [Gammaproteobacteria bacterium]|nr:M20/M25/M40 family metallo-hydrolase [Gammaproteobacteria bacterium]MBQ0840468.1 M20/M25/M40 family metallo-hydrolase [Gammaproteobacteria bacterium]
MRGVFSSHLIKPCAGFLLLLYSLLCWPAERDTRTLLADYIHLDTSNPPGNEALGAAFFAEIFAAHDIEHEIIEVAPGRANIWARLPGGDQPALLLLHHMDVVPADASRWQRPPFGGELDSAYLHGRGALDNKSLGIFHLQAMLALKAQHKTLKRDLIFLATADEEAGGKYGVGWLMHKRPELFGHIGAVLNEGGRGDVREGRLRFGIEVTQKLPLWLRVSASGAPGHGAIPRIDSASQRLIRALAKLEQFEFSPQLLPGVKSYLNKLASDLPAPWHKRLLNVEVLLDSPRQMAELHAFDRRLYAQLHSTCAITRLQASDKINVVAPQAWAELDCRLLPNHKPEQALQSIKAALDDESLELTSLLSFGPGISSPDNFLYRALEQNLAARFPQASIVPRMAAGFTDSHYFREKGIPAYGFIPLILDAEQMTGVHGDNEKISLENLRFGSDFLRELVAQVCLDEA